MNLPRTYRIILLSGPTPSVICSDISAHSPEEAMRRRVENNQHRVPLVAGTYLVVANDINRLGIFEYSPEPPAPKPAYTLKGVTL